MLIPCLTYRYNTDLRKYIGAFEISGSKWRVYHDAGHTDLNATSGALIHRYYVRDYLDRGAGWYDNQAPLLEAIIISATNLF